MNDKIHFIHIVEANEKHSDMMGVTHIPPFTLLY